MPRGHKPPSQRQLRVGEELRHIIARVIERGEFRDPDLLGRAITVTEVRVSPDLSNATVFVIPLGGGDCTPILVGLRRAKAFLRHEIGKSVQLRVVPNLSFESDHSFDEASKIEAILRSPEVARDLDLFPHPPTVTPGLTRGPGVAETLAETHLDPGSPAGMTRKTNDLDPDGS